MSILGQCSGVSLDEVNVWTALQTFNAGLRLGAGSCLQDSGGTNRLCLATVSPHLTLTGEIRAGSFAGIGVNPNTAIAALDISPPTAAGTPISALRLAGNQTPNANVGGVEILGVRAGLLHGAFTVGEYDGMVFAPAVSGSGLITKLVGISSLGTIVSAPITHFAAFEAGFISTLFNPAIANQYGLWVQDRGTANTITVYGVKVEDITAGTNRYLAWFGPTTPVLRLNAGIPAANQTMLYLAEGVTPTLRRVQWKDGAALVAGDKVLVLV